MIKDKFFDNVAYLYDSAIALPNTKIIFNNN